MGGSILDTGVLEVTNDVVGQLKQLQQEGMNPVRQLILVVGQTGPVDVPFQVIVQVLVRIQLCRAARQEKQVDPVGVLIHPVPHLFAVVGTEPISDEIDLLGRLSQQSLQEQDEQRCVQRAGVAHKVKLSGVADRRDDVTADVAVR